MSADDKARVVAAVAVSPHSKVRTLARLGISRRTYYNWVRRQREARLEGGDDRNRIPWNRLRAEEEEAIIAEARASPELSPRQLAFRLVDEHGCWVSESTVYRILRREGLVKRAEIKGFAADKEYHHKTRRPNEMWATDCCYLKVIDWGYYYLVTVMDDFSRYILAWELQKDMTAGSLIEVVQQAIEATGMSRVPVKDRTSLLSDNGSGYVSRAFGDYLEGGGYQAHSIFTISSPDQRQSGEVSADSKGRDKPDSVRYAVGAEKGYRGLCRVLQPPALP